MRLFLIFLGGLLIYLGRKGVLEALLMMPMGLGMMAVNAGVFFGIDRKPTNLFIDPLVAQTDDLVSILQVDWLQPIYTLSFSNGLIACLVFMGIGVLLDVGFMMARPFQSMFVALFAELGTVAVYPLAVWLGLTEGESAAVATIGGADGPMVLFASLLLAPALFVPITVVAYLYLGLTYGGYPYLIRIMVPKKLRAIQPPPPKKPVVITSGQKIVFAVVMCTLLCLLFPVASPLFFSLFLGIIIRESGLEHLSQLLGTTILYGATLFLGILLGVLTEANTIMNPQVLTLLLLGILALLISGIGGLLGGYALYVLTRGRFNPVIGIAGVSCVPTCAKVAQKSVAPGVIVLPEALGVSISGVITSAIFAGVFVTLLR
ncbi:sodium ion-translocating decarboxylase subunit beta [Phaeovibrio sulfidiphilus]|uniref:oxaloacetate decarboxylase (Na(+) extruding) n=2 Tax=Phaeovibrio sulfidiphilus TaxID=1220600 RepID=A0A8J6YPC1_9PROT|nr:sodium ion-translocating decarboxylase subunit beta [Phaeovibrio sulfidiphilus]